MKGLDHIPGYREAVTEERRRREQAWVGVVVDIAGVPVAPLTLRRFISLAVVGNSYVAPGKSGTVADVIQFLWMVSLEYRPDQAAFTAFAARITRSGDILGIMAGIDEYIAAAFFDTNASDSPGTASTPAWGWPASWVDQYAREYGWSVDQVMDTPIAQLLQLDRLLMKHAKPETTFANPLSDARKKQWLEEQNGRPAEPANLSGGRN